jgi:signal transduction histidine kinase
MMRRQNVQSIQPEQEGGLVSREHHSDGPDAPVAAVSAALQSIARLKAAGADPDTLHEAVAFGLAGIVPGSSVAVLSIEPIRPIVRVLSSSGPSTLIVSVDRARLPGSFITECSRVPLSVFRIAGESAKDQFELGDDGIRLATILGIAVPIGASSTWIFLLAAPADAAIEDAHENLRIFGRILRSVLRPTRDEGQPEDVDEAIRRAKDEWELTADALPHIVCLLDAAGRVLRANRAVERWSLGSIEGTPGKNFHDLLHPGCDEKSCQLRNGVSNAFDRMQRERRRAYEFKITDRQLARVIKVRLGRMLEPNSPERESAAVCAVLVIQDVTEFEVAQHQLASMNSELELRVKERTRDLAESNLELQNEIARRAATEEQLRLKSSELAALSRELMNAQEHERKRISRELHDSVGQSLNALKYGLERIAELERQGNRSGTLAALQKAIVMAQETMNEIRSIALDLRPSVLDNLGAASAVVWFCRAFASSYPDLEVVLDISARDEQVPARLATTIFRSLQELLNNVSRHAKAQRVDVSLRLDAGQVVLEVKDDGVGLRDPVPAPGARHGHGMQNLRERAELTGGAFELGSGSPKGAVARICWQLQPGEAAAPESELNEGKDK